jgi:hypothetical protein
MPHRRARCTQPPGYGSFVKRRSNKAWLSQLSPWSKSGLKHSWPPVADTAVEPLGVDGGFSRAVNVISDLTSWLEPPHAFRSFASKFAVTAPTSDLLGS